MYKYLKFMIWRTKVEAKSLNRITAFFNLWLYSPDVFHNSKSVLPRVQNATEWYPPSAPQPNQCLTYPYYSLHSNALLIPKSMPYYSLCGKWNHFKGIPAAVLFKFFTWSPQKANANLVHLPVTVPGSVYGLLLLCCFLACVSWVKFMDSFTCHPQNVG